MEDALKTWIAMHRKSAPLIEIIKATRKANINHNTDYIETIQSNIKFLAPEWSNGKLIRIYVDSDVHLNLHNKYMTTVKSGIEELLSELNLDFKCDCIGIDADVDTYIKNSFENGRLNPDIVKKYVLNEPHRDPKLGGTPHADVIITNKNLIGYPANFGWGNHRYGLIVISSTLSEMRLLSKHEATHLMGHNTHHGKNDLGDPKEWSYELSPCIADPMLRTSEICFQCYDYIIAHWIGYERFSREQGRPIKFFKD
jgi:hypothetical protein